MECSVWRSITPMRAQQIVWNNRAGWTAAEAKLGEASLVLYFGTRQSLADGARYEELRGMFPKAHLMGCSTGGQINNDSINDDEIVAAAVASHRTAVGLDGRVIRRRQTSAHCAHGLTLR